MRVHVDMQKCQGHGLCHANAPEVYEVDDLGYCRIPNEEIPPELAKQARRGAVGCPEQAITISD